MEVLKYPNDLLREKSVEVSVFDELLKCFSNQMTEAMYVGEGVGLAAPQLGVHRRVIVVDPSGGEDASQHLVLVNPKIVNSLGKTISSEGCLSVPGVIKQIERLANIEVEYQDLSGERQRLYATGQLSIIIQHEIDHLDGILIVDRAKESKKIVSRSMKQYDSKSA